MGTPVVAVGELIPHIVLLYDTTCAMQTGYYVRLRVIRLAVEEWYAGSGTPTSGSLGSSMFGSGTRERGRYARECEGRGNWEYRKGETLISWEDLEHWHSIESALDMDVNGEKQIEDLENSLPMAKHASGNSYERAASEIWGFLNTYLCIRFWFIFRH